MYIEDIYNILFGLSYRYIGLYGIIVVYVRV